MTLAHPEAVAGIDCGSARCELAEGAVAVRNVPAQATQLTLTARLAPRFFVRRGERLETSDSEAVTLLRCPLGLVSGPPMREVEDPHLLIRMDDRCRGKARLRWFIGTEPAQVVQEVDAAEGDYILLRASQLAGGSVTVTATRADTLAGVVGTVTSPTIPPPRPQSTIELLGHGPIGFIPTNREALWTVAGVANARLVPLDVPGAYTVRREKNRIFLRGERNSGGFVNLRFAYRRDDLPKGFEDTNLAILSEAIERPLREASIPVPFTATATRPEPLVEFQCADAHGITVALPAGKPASIPYSARETCRVLIYQQRLLPEDGQQEVVLEVEVTKADGGKRSEASMSEHLVLHPGGEMRAVYLKGITEEHDQITVRLSHVVDETRYLLGTRGKAAPPSAQWSASVEGGRARLYVSLSVPAGLYRINAAGRVAHPQLRRLGPHHLARPARQGRPPGPRDRRARRQLDSPAVQRQPRVSGDPRHPSRCRSTRARRPRAPPSACTCGERTNSAASTGTRQLAAAPARRPTGRCSSGPASPSATWARISEMGTLEGSQTQLVMETL